MRGIGARSRSKTTSRFSHQCVVSFVAESVTGGVPGRGSPGGWGEALGIAAVGVEIGVARGVRRFT